METVMERIKKIQQPKCGYLPLSLFEKIEFNDGVKLTPFEDKDIASIVGSVVDYMTRFLFSGDFFKSFEISLRGLSRAAILKKDETFDRTFATELDKVFFNEIVCKGLSDDAIRAACQLASFDVWYRDPRKVEEEGIMPRYYMKINPNSWTIKNIRTFIIRTLAFFDRCGSVKNFGFEVKNNLGTLQGDGDFLTSDTLWDLKVARENTMEKSAKNYTLQILMYYLMGKHSGQEIFKDITKIGIFNPRFNVAYTLEASKIPQNIIEAVERDVICY